MKLIILKITSIFISIYMLSTSIASSSMGLSENSRRNARLLYTNKARYQIESHNKYDFKACANFEQEDEGPDYFIRCDENYIVRNSSISDLMSTSDAIEKSLYERNLLTELQDHTTEELQKNIHQLENINKCTTSTSPQCQNIKESILKVVKDELPSLRATMAMMNPPFQHHGMRAQLYTRAIKHEVPTGDISHLTDAEAVKVEEEAQAIKHHFEQQWFAENINGERRNNCIEQISPNSYQFRPTQAHGYSCAGFQKPKLDRYVAEKITNYRSSLKNNYFERISQNPILAHLNLTGTEDEEAILAEVGRVTNELSQSSKQSLDKINNLTNEELSSLMRKDNIVNSFLSQRGPSKVLCDVAQGIKDDEDFNELTEDLLLAGGTLIGGGVCALTAGVGCVIGVAIASETIGIAVAQNRYEDAALSFNSGLSTAQDYEARKFDRDFTLLLAPLSFVGETIGTGARLTSKAIRQSPDGNSFNYDVVGIRQRDQFRQRTNFQADSIPTNKSAFISQYENYILASPRLNGRWIANARSNNAALYLDIENAALKRLNDTIGDKSYVTALTNLHKDITSSKINEVLKNYPQVEIEVYSDFKSVRYAFRPKELPAEIKEKLMKDLEVAYQSANSEYANMLKTMEGIPSSEDPNKWFQAGLGQSADQAGQSARKARQLDRSGSIVKFDQIQDTITQEVSAINNYNRSLHSNHPLVRAGLTESVSGSDATIPSLAVFEVARKVSSPSPDEVNNFIRTHKQETGQDIGHVEASNKLRGQMIADQLNSKFGAQLTSQQGEELIGYTNHLDSLTPGLWVQERVNANLNGAQFGGMSGDVTGMGARNIRQVALDIDRANSSDAAEIIRQTRLGEQEVTQTFDDIKQNFNDTVKRVMQERRVGYEDPCSGDDCVMIPSRALTSDDEVELVRAFSQQSNPSQYRLSFIPPGVSAQDRTNLAVHGELVEKQLRKKLMGVGEGKINPSQLSQLTIATRMPNQINSGPVNLILGVGENTNLTDAQKSLIQTQLQQAVQEVNQELGEEMANQSINYTAAGIQWVR